MPISDREFESGHTESALFVLGVLEQVFPYALNQSDLMTEVANKGRQLDLEQLRDILYILVQQDKVASKSIEDVIYYRYKKRTLGFRSSKG